MPDFFTSNNVIIWFSNIEILFFLLNDFYSEISFYIKASALSYSIYVASAFSHNFWG